VTVVGMWVGGQVNKRWSFFSLCQNVLGNDDTPCNQVSRQTRTNRCAVQRALHGVVFVRQPDWHVGSQTDRRPDQTNRAAPPSFQWLQADGGNATWYGWEQL
jgi:hypothetical protein